MTCIIKLRHLKRILVFHILQLNKGLILEAGFELRLDSG